MADDRTDARGTEPTGTSATEMTDAERRAFLADVRVGVLAVQRDGKGPLALPIWYDLDGDDVIVSIDADSAKAALLRRYGRATLTVQDERAPYRYVSIEGPVRLDRAPHDVTALAVRYLGPDLGPRYAAANPPGPTDLVVRLTPERWLTCDYGKISR